MIVDLKVDVEIVHFFETRDFFPEFAKVVVSFAKDLAKDFIMRSLRKINVGFAKDSRK
jgi:hypothetical protein